MQKLGLSQSFQQKLSPQQIQFIKLLQIPTAELNARIEEEFEINPALEDAELSDNSDEEPVDDYDQEEPTQDKDGDDYDDIPLTDYLQDDYIGYKMQGDGPNPDEEERDIPFTTDATLLDSLMTQLGFCRLEERESIIATQLIGSIDNDGYIRRDLEAIVNDLAFSVGLETDEDEIESVLYKVQMFEPAGIGARTLQECLLLQIKRKQDGDISRYTAKKILENHFEEFTKKHYDKIAKNWKLMKST